MKTFLLVFQIVIAVLLIFTVLSQEKGAGLSATFGGTGQFFRGRRGVDKVLLWITVVLAILFVSSSLSFLLIKDAPAPTQSEVSNEAAGSPASIKVNAVPVKTAPAAKK